MCICVNNIPRDLTSRTYVSLMKDCSNANIKLNNKLKADLFVTIQSKSNTALGRRFFTQKCFLSSFFIKSLLITLTFDLPQPGEHKFSAIKFKRRGIKLTPRMTYQLIQTSLCVHHFYLKIHRLLQTTIARRSCFMPKYQIDDVLFIRTRFV